METEFQVFYSLSENLSGSGSFCAAASGNPLFTHQANPFSNFTVNYNVSGEAVFAFSPPVGTTRLRLQFTYRSVFSQLLTEQGDPEETGTYSYSAGSIATILSLAGQVLFAETTISDVVTVTTEIENIQIEIFLNEPSHQDQVISLVVQFIGNVAISNAKFGPSGNPSVASGSSSIQDTRLFAFVPDEAPPCDCCCCGEGI